MNELQTLEQVVYEDGQDDSLEVIKKGAKYSKMLVSSIFKYFESGIKPRELEELSTSYPTYRKILQELDLQHNEVARRAFILGSMRSVYDSIYLLEEEVEASEEMVTRGQKHLFTILMLLEKRDMTPGDIVEETGLTKSNVSYVLSSIQPYGYIDSKEYSKSKYYYITYKGRRFLKAKSRATSISIRQHEETIEQLLIYLTTSIRSEPIKQQEMEKGLLSIASCSTTSSNQTLRIRVKELVSTVFESTTKFQWNLRKFRDQRELVEYKPTIEQEDPDDVPIGPVDLDTYVNTYSG